MVFERIEIVNFRGIRHLILDDVKQINLLTKRLHFSSDECAQESMLSPVIVGYRLMILREAILSFWLRDTVGFLIV